MSWEIMDADEHPVCSVHQGMYTDGIQKTYNASCCLTMGGSYTLYCQDSHGDGWGDGYIMIGGTMYCNDFNAGSLKMVSFNMQPVSSTVSSTSLTSVTSTSSLSASSLSSSVTSVTTSTVVSTPEPTPGGTATATTTTVGVFVVEHTVRFASSGSQDEVTDAATEMVSNMYEVPDEQITVTVTEATERGARRLTATNWNVDYQVQTNQFEVDAIMEIAHEMDSDIAKLTEAIRETFAQRGLQVDAATVESEPPSSMQVTATRTTMTSVTTATMTGNSPQTASTGTSNEAETDEASGNTALFAIIGVVAAVLMLTVGIVVMKKRRRDNVNTADDPASNFRPPDTNYEDGPRLSSV